VLSLAEDTIFFYTANALYTTTEYYRRRDICCLSSPEIEPINDLQAQVNN